MQEVESVPFVMPQQATPYAMGREAWAQAKLGPTAGDHWVVDLAAEKGAEYVPVHRLRTGSAG